MSVSRIGMVFLRPHVRHVVQTSIRNMSASSTLLAGHAKWQNIMHTKAKNDAKRSKQFAKMATQITTAAREGNELDPALNPRLAMVIDIAMKNNLPKKVVESAIARAGKPGAAGDGSASMVYEGVGPGGVAVMIEVQTDNKNRTAQMIRSALAKVRGSLNPCAYLFERRGYVVLGPANGGDNVDTVFEWTLELGDEYTVEDVVESPEGVVIITAPQSLQAVAVAARGKFALQNAELRYEPNKDTIVPVGDEELEQSLGVMLNALDEVDDVTAVYTNYAGQL